MIMKKKTLAEKIGFWVGWIIGKIIRLAIIGTILWAIISFVEIIFKNGNPFAVYSFWNLWQLIFK